MANWIYSTSSLLFVYLFLAWLVYIKNESFPISLKYERLDCQNKRIFFLFLNVTQKRFLWFVFPNSLHKKGVRNGIYKDKKSHECGLYMLTQRWAMFSCHPGLTFFLFWGPYLLICSPAGLKPLSCASVDKYIIIQRASCFWALWFIHDALESFCPFSLFLSLVL